MAGQSASISGKVYKVNGQTMAGVTVQAFDAGGNQVASVQTDAAGDYILEGLPTGVTYTIEPALGGPHYNGVTTYDIVLGAQHILGLQSLNNPFYIIAADVNQSQSLTTFDLVQMRRLVLQIIEEFPDSPSWRFFRNDIGFVYPNNPWAGYMGGVNFIALNEDIAGFDFTGVKTGDLNGNAQP